jgi:hypothetical protein
MAEIQVVFTQIGETQTVDLNAPRPSVGAEGNEDRSSKQADVVTKR